MLPVIKRNEFTQRRQKLMDLMGGNSIAIIPSSHEIIRSRDTHFSFRQDSDFYYLSGFNEPDAVLVLIPGRKHGEYVMFNREKDLDSETWHGRRFGQDGVEQHYAVNDAFPIDDIDDILPGLLEGRDKIFYALGANHEFDEQVMNWLNSLRGKVHQGALPVGEMIDIRHLLHDMRLFKSKAEIKMMRYAAEVSAKAHITAMQSTKAGMYEWQVEANLHHQMAAEGCRFQAYSSIVAGGDNACILHYTENQDKLKAKEMLLIDAGGEYQGYAADITRTFPINGKFTRAQKKLYQLVLDAQLAAIETIKPGSNWSKPHHAAVEVLTEGMIKLGLLKGRLSTLIKKQAYLKYYMHKTGHWLGLDVHDVGDYRIGGHPRALEAGMVMTVEPGIYIPKDDKKAPKEFLGTGIRIEDDVLVTESGYEILSKGAPKTIAEIEQIMAA
jgi:Xaa-Pro aminopeptidase